MKKYLVVIIIVLILVDALIIGALAYINTKNKGEEVNTIYNVDRIFNEQVKNKKGELYNDVITEYIIEEEYKVSANTNIATVNIIKRIKEDNIFVNIVPTSDALGIYNILKDTNNGYGVFSYTKQGKLEAKPEETYRYYLKDNKVVAVTNFEKNAWFQPVEEAKVELKTIENVEKAYKYYINYEAELN